MTKINQAIQLDINQEYEAAANAYEKLIEEKKASIEHYINLACLYWYVTDFGINASNSLSVPFIKRAGNRIYSVLQQAVDSFGRVAEIEFWKRYFDFTVIGESAFPEKALSLAVDGNILIPYFHVYKQTVDEKYLAKVTMLLEICKATPTTKHRYIISLLEN
jgi:hypothetical protein